LIHKGLLNARNDAKRFGVITPDGYTETIDAFAYENGLFWHQLYLYALLGGAGAKRSSRPRENPVSASFINVPTPDLFSDYSFF
jgi:hypothetical protein